MTEKLTLPEVGQIYTETRSRPENQSARSVEIAEVDLKKQAVLVKNNQSGRRTMISFETLAKSFYRDAEAEAAPATIREPTAKASVQEGQIWKRKKYPSDKASQLHPTFVVLSVDTSANEVCVRDVHSLQTRTRQLNSFRWDCNCLSDETRPTAVRSDLSEARNALLAPRPLLAPVARAAPSAPPPLIPDAVVPPKATTPRRTTPIQRILNRFGRFVKGETP